MPITQATLRQLRLLLPRSSCGGMLARQLHVTARARNSTAPTHHATDLPAKNVYHEFFPCTLHYYSCHGPTMAMHATSSEPSSESDVDKEDNRLGQDVVRVQEDGLVYPGPEGNDPVWNGAMMMPHATFLLEITENYYDGYEEQKAAGHNVPEPYFFTVPKGLRIPNALLLAHQHGEMFHLMPRVGISLSALNRELNNFFSSSSCSKLPFREWYKKYNFLEAYNNPGEDNWMSK